MSRQEMIRPIFGIETEVPAAVTMHSSAAAIQTPAAVVEALLSSLGTDVLPGVATLGEKNNQRLGNGWRAYIDIGSLMELAGGETHTIDQAVTQDFGVERTIDELFAFGKERALYHDYAVGNRALHVNRINGELQSVSSIGRHQSIGMPRGNVDISPAALETFGVMTAIRSLLVGTGAILLPDAYATCRTADDADHGNTVFSLSQKVPVIYTDFSTNTTSKRPLVNLRNASYAGDSFVRVHDASSEHTPSPWAKRMSLGLDLVALMLTHYGVQLPDHGAIKGEPLHQFARRLTFDLARPDSFSYGETTKQAIAIHRTFIALGKRLCEKVIPSEDFTWTVGEWERALDDFEEAPKKLSDRSDWVAKKVVLTQFVNADSDRTWSDRVVEDKDRQWDNTGPRGFATKLRKGSWKKWMPSEAAIRQSQYEPTSTTRARARGELITFIAAIDPSAQPNWEGVRTGNCRITLPDPHDAGPDNIAAWARPQLRAARLRASDDEYRYQQKKAAKRRLKNESRRHSRPRR